LSHPVVVTLDFIFNIINPEMEIKTEIETEIKMVLYLNEICRHI